MEERTKELGGRLAVCLFQLIHSVRIHKDNNQLITEGVSRCLDVIKDLGDGGEVSINAWRSRLYVNGERLGYTRGVAALMNELGDYLGSRDIGGVSFLDPQRGDLHGRFVVFVRLLDEASKHEDPVGWLNGRLIEKGIHWIRVHPRIEDGSADHDMETWERALAAYSHALKVVREAADKASKGTAGVRNARRVAQRIVDLIHEDSTVMLVLATIRDYDDYTYVHSVNVAMLSASLGRFLGMSRVSLEHLVVCGLFHDLGKVGIPKEILTKRGSLSHDEWETMRTHPFMGVSRIVNLRAPHVLRSRIILGPFEHHLNPDLSGYPKTHFTKGVSIIGRILRIVDVYDALTSERVYRPRAFTPEEALRRMWSEQGTSFDPVLLKCFVRMMGIYPIGSVVELEGGGLGIVKCYTDEAKRDRPLIVMIDEDGAGGYVCGQELDLSGMEAAGDSSGTNVLRSVPASMLGIEPFSLLYGTQAA
jgi:HD-GYP domain-containing protein (c-di-GMP phosphodiesterase class II)